MFSSVAPLIEGGKDRSSDGQRELERDFKDLMIMVIFHTFCLRIFTPCDE